MDTSKDFEEIKAMYLQTLNNVMEIEKTNYLLDKQINRQIEENKQQLVRLNRAMMCPRIHTQQAETELLQEYESIKAELTRTLTKIRHNLTALQISKENCKVIRFNAVSVLAYITNRIFTDIQFSLN